MARVSKKIRDSANKKFREGRLHELTEQEKEWFVKHSAYAKSFPKVVRMLKDKC